MGMKTFLTSFLAASLLFTGFPSYAAAAQGVSADVRPESFVDIQTVIPDVLLDIRYFGDHNFLGERVDGYLAPRCWLTKPAARALAGVQNDLRPFAMTIKIYDCYRPQQAVDHFVRWAKEIYNVRTKEEFYPTVDKRNLFRDGYIAEKSSHSRGSTVDLTIVSLPASLQPPYRAGEPLVACYLPVGVRFADNGIDMGTGFDCFHELSHPENKNLSPQHRGNRLLLKTLMEKHGFNYYDKEWWHFTLAREPYPDTWFNFPVQ